MITRHLCRHVAVGILFMIISIQGYSQAKTWPYPVPCRINANISQDILFLTLGDVTTPVSQGTFYPVEDKVVLNDGSVINNYYVDSLGVQYYQPIDKTYYPTAPSGWTSWQTYQSMMDADTIKMATDFFAKNLQQYGFNMIQIDDGWETPWYIWNPRPTKFPNGMKAIADYIKQNGFEAGLWIVPQCTNDSEETIKYNGFLKNSNGQFTHTSEWLYTVDPTLSDGQKFMKDLMDTVCSWGFSYIKMDSQPHVDTTFDTLASYMNEPNMTRDYYYRRSLAAIRNGAGTQTYLDATWGPGVTGVTEGNEAPLSGLGYINGFRPYWDLQKPTQYYFKDYFNGVMFYSFLSNIACYVDLDAFFVGNNTSLDQARGWATMVSLSGANMLNADPPDQLNNERLEVLRRVYPTVDVRPLDLYPIYHYRKHIWDLKINQGFRQYDVVAVIKTDYYFQSDLVIHWNLMGWNPDDSYHVYDFWNKQYVGEWKDSMAVVVPDSGCRLFSFVKAEDIPQLISTSRHVTQGWVDIDTLAYDSVTMVMSGISSVVGGDPYQLRFAVPNNIQDSYSAVSAEVGSLPFTLRQDSNFITLDFTSPVSAQVPWKIQFIKGPLSVGNNAAPPAGITLYQNYPNPFGMGSAARTDFSTFSFSVTEPQTMDIGVYDLLGNRVATLFNGYASAGTYHVGFDGSALHYGVYYSMLHADGVYRTKSFILEK
ncbi:MAG TPA: alpha-galactosidase [Candidatus Kapabacteria bacterium]|nr:alpha-galactosidase [Candidatus Kapabacteria bacterium]